MFVSGESEVHAVQSLTASLGGAGANAVAGAGAVASAGSHQSLATVCRMTRSVLFPPQFKTLREWFLYAFADSEIDGKRFDSLITTVLDLCYTKFELSGHHLGLNISEFGLKFSIL